MDEESVSGDTINIDMNRVMESYQLQIAGMAHQLAIKDSIIGAQRDQITAMREHIDTLAVSIPEESERQSAPKIPSRDLSKPKKDKT